MRLGLGSTTIGSERNCKSLTLAQTLSCGLLDGGIEGKASRALLAMPCLLRDRWRIAAQSVSTVVDDRNGDANAIRSLRSQRCVRFLRRHTSDQPCQALPWCAQGALSQTCEGWSRH